MRDFQKVRLTYLTNKKKGGAPHNKGERSLFWGEPHRDKINVSACRRGIFPTDWITWISWRRFLQEELRLHVGASGGSLRVGMNCNQRKKSQPTTNSWTIKGTTLEGPKVSPKGPDPELRTRSKAQLLLLIRSMKVVRSQQAGRERSGLLKGWGLLEICQIRALPSIFNLQPTSSIHLCHNGGSFEWGKPEHCSRERKKSNYRSRKSH